MVSGYFDGINNGEERGIRGTFCNIVCPNTTFMKIMYGYYKGYIVFWEIKRFIRHWVGSISIAAQSKNAKRNPRRDWLLVWGKVCELN